MSIVLQLAGYDKNTDLISVYYQVPPSVVDYVKQIAAVDANDPDVLGSYPVNDVMASKIAAEIKTPINPKLYNYFIEAYEND
jgi:hypothetical protein